MILRIPEFEGPSHWETSTPTAYWPISSGNCRSQWPAEPELAQVGSVREQKVRPVKTSEQKMRRASASRTETTALGRSPDVQALFSPHISTESCPLLYSR